MSQSVFYRQIVCFSTLNGTERRTADFVVPDTRPGFFTGLVDGQRRTWHRENVIKSVKVIREVDRDGHPQDETVEEIKL